MIVGAIHYIQKQPGGVRLAHTPRSFLEKERKYYDRNRYTTQAKINIDQANQKRSRSPRPLRGRGAGGEGWPVTAKQADAPSLTTYFKKKDRTIRNWLATAREQMGTVLGENI